MVDFKTAMGWLTENERMLLFQQAQAVPPGGVAVNIGVEYGASVHALAAGLAADTTLHIVDLDMSKFIPPNAPGCAPSPTCRIIITEGSSHLLSHSAFGAIDLLFIDGDHSFDGVLLDSDFGRHVKTDGVIIFHDCIPCTGIAVNMVPGVNLAVNHWLQDNDHLWQELVPVSSCRIFKHR